MVDPMTSPDFRTPQIRRLLWQLQLFLTLIGLMMLGIGAARVLLETFGFISDLASAFRPDLFTTESLILGIGLAVVGYGALYAATAVGAGEPIAIGAIRNSFIGIVSILILLVGWLVTVAWVYVLVMTFVTAGLGFLIWRFWQRIEQLKLWQVFGQSIHRKRPSKFFYVGIALAILILAAIGVVNAVLTDRIEMTLPDTQAGELLYTTTFDAFNDEWDFPSGSRKAEIVDGHMVLTLDSGKTEDGFYSLLEKRKFRDFDLRVTAQHLSGDIDNTFGVVFRQRDLDNYYVFEISGDGYYRLKVVENNRATNITQWIESPIVQTDNGVNEIRVVGKGDTFTFYVNQQLVRLCTKGDSAQPTLNPLTGECISNEWETAFQDGTFQQGHLGLSVGNTATSDVTEPIVVAFDNLIVVGPAND